MKKVEFIQLIPMLVFTYVSHPAAIAVCILSSSGGVDGGTVIQQEFFQLRL